MNTRSEFQMVSRRPLMIQINNLGSSLKKEIPVVSDREHQGKTVGERLKIAFQDLTGMPVDGEPEFLFEFVEGEIFSGRGFIIVNFIGSPE
jgi:hypothetical protein